MSVIPQFFKKENLVSPTAKHSVRHWGKEMQGVAKTMFQVNFWFVNWEIAFTRAGHCLKFYSRHFHSAIVYQPLQ